MAGLDGEVKVPGVGQVPKKAAAAGVLVVATLIGVYYYRKRKSGTATAAQAATSTDQYPPDGTVGNPQDPYSTDPATGQTYGDEAVGSGGTFGAFGGLGSDGGGGGTSGTGTGGPPFSDNASWSNYVIQQFASINPSADLSAFTDAIGLYLAGQQVTQVQAGLIYDAEAIGGQPPVAGTNNFPPQLHIGSSSGGGTVAHNPVSGLRAHDVDTTQATLSWDASAHATSYRVIVKAGNTRAQTQSSSGTSIRLHDLKPRTSYDAQVLALPTDSSGYSNEARTSFKTK